MKYQNRRFQNIGILIVVAVFLSLAFIGNTGSAQTKKGKATPTPKSKKATPTPKKNAKAKATPTPKSKAKSNQKTTAKATPTPKKSANTKAKTASKTDKNPKSKTTKETKTSPKKPQTASTKTTKTTNRNSRTVTPVKTKTNTTSKTSKPTTTPTTRELTQIIVSSPSTAIRSAPTASASEVSRAKLGATYSVVERSSGWYKIQIPNRTNTTTGWIPTTVAVNSDKNGNEEIYKQVLAKFSPSASLPFGEFAELYEFLTRVQPEIKDANTAAEFGLKRLQTLRFALNAIPNGQKNQKVYQDFLKAQDENIVYSEPAGEWYVRAPLYWELHSKSTATPSGEKIAWEAARTPLPGECEGYVNCYIFLLRMTDGEYLNFYPTGAHAAEALRNITNSLQPIAADAETKKVYNGPSDVSDRAEFYSLITELRVILSRLPNTEKERAVQQLKKIAEGYK